MGKARGTLTNTHLFKCYHQSKVPKNNEHLHQAGEVVDTTSGRRCRCRNLSPSSWELQPVRKPTDAAGSYPSPSVSPQSRVVELVDDKRSFSPRCPSPECFNAAFSSADAGPVPAGALFGAMPTPAPLFRTPSPSPSISSSLNQSLFGGRESPQLPDLELPARFDKGKGRLVVPSEPADTIRLVPLSSSAPPRLDPPLRHPRLTSVRALRSADRSRGPQGPFSSNDSNLKGSRKAKKIEAQLGPELSREAAERETELAMLVLVLGPALAMNVDELEDDE